MARPFDSTEAKILSEKHRALLAELTRFETFAEDQRHEVSQAAGAMAEQETLRLLADIPVEELNRDKRGFRIKLLRDSGYETVADIKAASLWKLTAINGISSESARAIKQAAEEIAGAARQGARIRLSEDARSRSATRLVRALSRLKNGGPPALAAQKLRKEYGDEIESALEALRPATGGLKWLFCSRQKKQQAIEAYDTLRTLLRGAYFRRAQELRDELTRVEDTSAARAWADFSANSIQFFNLLEEIEPGVLGTDDAVYGLPEDLAREIQAQEFFPEGLRCQLRRYQEWGVKYALHQRRVLLGDEMGLGKTIQAIAVMVSLRNTGATHFLVVCPASVLTNWCREIQRMSDLPVTKVHGQDRTEALAAWQETGGVAVTTYETTGHLQLEPAFRYALLVVDEAHYIKNPEAQRTRSVKALSEHAQRLLFMTGTALENRVDEMISLIRLLQPQVASAVRGMEFLAAAPQFREKVAPVYYRRKREDVLTELPELIENREWCSMTAREEAVYEDAVLSSRYADARRVSWNVDDLSDSSKARRMQELIGEAKEDGRKVIVFSFFLDTIRKITELLGETCYGPVTGSVPPQRRQEIVDRFDAAPAGSVLVAQIQAGGTGLNIQSASVVILCEPQFKPSSENQAIARAYRMGQTRNVLVYRLLCEDSVDERILALLEDKQAIFDAFADPSAAASQCKELDDKSFGRIMQEERDRIHTKRGEIIERSSQNETI